MRRYYTLLVLVAFAFALNSCNKKGCSDPTADNYVKNVKKARDNKCEYDGEGICGVGVTFCFDRNNVKVSNGTIGYLDGTGPGQSYKKIIWTNGQTFGTSAYEDMIIEIYGTDISSNYSLSNSGNNKTFRAEYYLGATGQAYAATSGKLEVRRDNTTDGLIATFEFTTINGIEIDNGNFYKLKP